MTPATAVSLIEGTIDADSQEQVIEAWQYLIDTGIILHLQGSTYRMAQQLIDAGICIEPPKDVT